MGGSGKGGRGGNAAMMAAWKACHVWQACRGGSSLCSSLVASQSSHPEQHEQHEQHSCHAAGIHGIAMSFISYVWHQLSLTTLACVTRRKQQRPGIAKNDKNNVTVKTINKPTKPHPNSQRTTLQTCAPNIRCTTHISQNSTPINTQVTAHHWQ